jgi:hypothetical protein
MSIREFRKEDLGFRKWSLEASRANGAIAAVEGSLDFERPDFGGAEAGADFAVGDDEGSAPLDGRDGRAGEGRRSELAPGVMDRVVGDGFAGKPGMLLKRLEMNV